jgi:uncharacterized protein YpmB
MSNRNLALVAIIVIIIAVLVWFFAMHNKAKAPVEGTDQSPAATTTLPSGTSTSDAALNEDLSSIGAQMQGLDSDSANADASLNESAQAQ